MKETIEYFFTTTAMGSVDVADVCNCALCISNDEYNEWYLSVDSRLGVAQVTTFGPIAIDCNMLGEEFVFHRMIMECNERKVANVIKKFIQDPKKLITQATEIDKQQVADRFKNLTLL